jgi:hypothetical protein
VKFLLLGGRLTVGLRTLNPPIGVRIPASQPHIINELRAATWPPVFCLCAYSVPELFQPVRDSGRMIVAQQFTAGIMSQGLVVRERTADADILWRFQSSASRTKVLVPSVPAMNRWAILSRPLSRTTEVHFLCKAVCQPKRKAFFPASQSPLAACREAHGNRCRASSQPSCVQASR